MQEWTRSLPIADALYQFEILSVAAHVYEKPCLKRLAVGE